MFSWELVVRFPGKCPGETLRKCETGKVFFCRDREMWCTWLQWFLRAKKKKKNHFWKVLKNYMKHPEMQKKSTLEADFFLFEKAQKSSLLKRKVDQKVGQNCPIYPEMILSAGWGELTDRRHTLRPRSHRTQRHVCAQICVQTLRCCFSSCVNTPMTTMWSKICVRVLQGAPRPVWTGNAFLTLMNPWDVWQSENDGQETAQSEIILWPENQTFLLVKVCPNFSTNLISEKNSSA